MKSFRGILLTIIAVGVSIFSSFATTGFCFASGKGFSVSPMSSSMLLNPGETYSGSFKVSEPSDGETSDYKVSVRSYYVDENYVGIYGGGSDYSMMADWITIDSPTSGTVVPSEIDEVVYTIQVPDDAPAGGQYAAIVVTLDELNNRDDKGDEASLQEVMEIAHIIYAEIAGDTIRQGEIKDLSLSSFIMSGDIKGSALIENTGNVHGNAKYVLQVFPLFSNEEIYTNEEKPDVRTILPERALYNETTWKDTPPVGIFNVVYTVEFEGVTAQVSKMVIKCPIWLLFIVIFAIFALIFYFVAKAKARKKAAKRAEKTA